MRRVTRGDRLLVSTPGRCPSPNGAIRISRLASDSRSSSPPISSARPSTRPAAGSTACWPSARCCLVIRRQPVPTPTFRIAFPHPFRNCIVLGLMLGEWWESADGKQRYLSEAEARHDGGKKYVQHVGKMSKRTELPQPAGDLRLHGADALRWYFFANQPPWTSIRYSEQAIKDSIPEFLLRLWNVYSFFVIYANIDGFDPAVADRRLPEQLAPSTFARGASYRPVAQRGELDRWVLSELHQTIGCGRPADGRLRQLRRLHAAHCLRRRAEQLVRPPQPRSVLER